MAREQRVFFEDIAVGQTESFGRYEVTAEEIVDFARKYDPQPYHLDPEAAKESIFGALCASGWHTCAMTMRMMVDHLADIGSASLGSPGVDELRWTRPVYAGDVLRVEGRVLEVRRLRTRPRTGIVRTRYAVLNQKDETVMTMIANGFVAARTDG